MVRIGWFEYCQQAVGCGALALPGWLASDPEVIGQGVVAWRGRIGSGLLAYL